IVIHADKVDRLSDQIHVFIVSLRPCITEHLDQLLRISPKKNRIEIMPVPISIGTPGSENVLFGRRSRVFWLEVRNNSYTRPLCSSRAKRLHCTPVRAKKVVRYDRHFIQIAMTRREIPV